jgi:hypothetical protein
MAFSALRFASPQRLQNAVRYRGRRSTSAVCGAAFAVFFNILENAGAGNGRAKAGIEECVEQTYVTAYVILCMGSDLIKTKDRCNVLKGR